MLESGKARTRARALAVLLVGMLAVGPWAIAQPPLPPAGFPPPASSPERRGMPPWGLDGPGPGWVGMAREGRSIDSAEELASVMERMVQIRRRFERVEHERTSLLDELNRRRGGYRPDSLAPPALLTRQQIERLLAEVTARVEEGNHLVRQAAWMTGRLLRQRTRWEPLIDQPPGLAPEQAQRLGRALAALDETGQPGFARALLGEPLGDLVIGTLASVPPEWTRPHDDATTGLPWQNAPHFGGGPREWGTRPPLPPPMRRRLHDRLQRMERRHEEISAMLTQQAAEIERLRLLLENVPEEETPPEDLLE